MDEYLLPRSIPLTSFRQAKLAELRAHVKRLIDIVGVLIAIPLSSPIMVLATILIKLDSPGPVLFAQERAGKDGKSFKMLKFRSMVVNAEELLDRLEQSSRSPVPVLKIKDDPRITRVGHFMRRWSIDELPQLFNVLKGDMSLVGPRPEESRIVEQYSSWHCKRLTAKPGLTGPMQVNGRGDLSFEERARLEIDYIENYTLLRDIEILLKTIPAIILGHGAY